jgi:hypothetical protein
MVPSRRRPPASTRNGAVGARSVLRQWQRAVRLDDDRLGPWDWPQSRGQWPRLTPAGEVGAVITPAEVEAEPILTSVRGLRIVLRHESWPKSVTIRPDHHSGRALGRSRVRRRSRVHPGGRPTSRPAKLETNSSAMHVINGHFRCSPNRRARGHYGRRRALGERPNAALRNLANKLVVPATQRTWDDSIV